MSFRDVQHLLTFLAESPCGRYFSGHHFLIRLPPKADEEVTSPFIGRKTFSGVLQHSFSYGALAQTGSCAHCSITETWKSDFTGRYVRGICKWLLGHQVTLICHIPLAVKAINLWKGITSFPIPNSVVVVIVISLFSQFSLFIFQWCGVEKVFDKIRTQSEVEGNILNLVGATR